MRRRMNRFGPLATTAAAPVAGGQPPLQALPRAASPNRFVRWALYGFVFSLPFDAPGRLPLELTTMTGALFLAATVVQPRLCYGRRPAAFWWFLAYLYVYWMSYVLGGAQHSSDALRSFLFYLQGLLIFLACFNLMRYEMVTEKALFALVIACVTLALMTVLGVATKVGEGSHRVTVFGQNPNRAARVLVAGLLALVGLAYGRSRSALRSRFKVWPSAGLIGLALVMGGSRGGLLSLAAGLWTFAFGGKNLGIKLRNAFLALLAIGFVVWASFQSPVMMKRINEAQEGNLAGREKIFPAAWHMFREKPLIGWGPDNQYQLAVRLRLPAEQYASRDTHNLALEVLTGTGLLGSIPFFLGIWLCFWAAWKARDGTQGILPFAMIAALLVGNMSGNYIVLKLQWLILAYALASGSQTAGWQQWRAAAAAPLRLSRVTRRSAR